MIVPLQDNHSKADTPNRETKIDGAITISGGRYTIDPCMIIPPHFLPALGPDETEEARKNLSIHSSHGSVTADIWLMASQPRDLSTPQKRTLLCLRSDYGSVTTTIDGDQDIAPFKLEINAPHGTVSVALPRAFRGLLTLTTIHGSVSLSPIFTGNTTTLSQVNHVRRYFVGDFPIDSESEWDGNEVVVESTHSRIRIKYIDEGAAENKSAGGGFFSRLFGH
ncbi:hypothetical protein BJ138DRAFT_181323 [Hygrophoropsis aurantiaca]|uniref:Uncharacterized protein n=1 Tax=Hygrophoropsis aurantiaca TaxID=72124 RepID=A0ACB8A9S7_9AGAM|nr:hypothetical protein BJ138DRAFT_181323 [Hygrophoropsis aurantiaca]